MTAPPGLILIVGANGAGKTNLLEAIHFLAVCRSFRTSADRDLVLAGETGFALRAVACGREGERRFELGYEAPGRKRAAVNGEELPRLLDYVGAFPVVSFVPEDLALVKGEPALRRRFLDVWLGQQSREYLYSLQRYYDVLRRRNALLLRAASVAEREPYDAELVEAGAFLTATRARAATALAPVAAAAYAELAPAGETFAVSYLPSVSGPLDDRDGIAAAYREQLAAAAPEEARRQTSLVGPHRDDLAFSVGGDDARRFASEGQQRTAALSLRLAQFRLLRERRGDAPVMLLDDVASELDGRRQEALYVVLADAEQAWLTATAAAPALQLAAKFTCAGGKLTPTA